MTILVTGGAGYLGSHVVELLGSRCTVYDNLTYRDEYLVNVPFVSASVTDYDTLKSWLDRSKLVIWLAAIVGDAACAISPGRAMAVNVDAVRFLAENFDGPIIFTSTASVYGVSEVQSTEDSPLNPQSLYAETKIRAEEALAGKDALILRLGTLHGLSNRMRFDLVVNVMARDATMEKTIRVYGGEQKRPLLHVQDAAEYIRMWCGTYQAGTYNFASENVFVSEIAERVRAVISGTEIVRHRSGFEDRRDYSLDCSKLFGSVPLVGMRSVEESATAISGALRSGRIREPYHHRYINAKALQGWMINQD